MLNCGKFKLRCPVEFEEQTKTSIPFLVELGATRLGNWAKQSGPGLKMLHPSETNLCPNWVPKSFTETQGMVPSFQWRTGLEEHRASYRVLSLACGNIIQPKEVPPPPYPLRRARAMAPRSSSSRSPCTMRLGRNQRRLDLLVEILGKESGKEDGNSTGTNVQNPLSTATNKQWSGGVLRKLNQYPTTAFCPYSKKRS